MGCGCNSAPSATAPTAWTVYTPHNEALGSYRTEVEAASAASRVEGGTYRPDRV